MAKYSKIYIRWLNMRQRCLNKNNPNYHIYGGRGIKICDEWESFQLFQIWARSNGFHPSLYLDRIDPNGGYNPTNCRWVDAVVQATNKRNIELYLFNGERMSLAEICRQVSLDKRKVWHRIKRQNLTLEEAIKLGDGRSPYTVKKDTFKKRCESRGVNYNAAKILKSRRGLSEDQVFGFYGK